MTLRRWRIWYATGMTLLMVGLFLGGDYFKDGNPAWIGCALAAASGVTVVAVAGIRRRPTEKQEAADRAAAGPDLSRWRVVEVRDDDDPHDR